MAIEQSFAWWAFTLGSKLEPEVLLRSAAEIGYRGVELLPENLWPLAADCGLDVVTVAGHANVDVGFNDPANHERLRAEVASALDKAASAGVSNVIVFAGSRGNRNDAEGAAACAEGLASLIDRAEASGVRLLLEVLNSKVDHPGYQGDRTEWGRRVVDAVGSTSLRLLNDAYHMQIMEGDVITTIKQNLDVIAHIHTGGVPGRRDLDQRQELNFGAIVYRLAAYGYDGYIGHEFVPRGKPITALRSAFELCEEAIGSAASS